MLLGMWAMWFSSLGWAVFGSFGGLCGVPWRSLGYGKIQHRVPGDFKGYVGPMLGPMLWPCWVIWWLLWGSLEVSGKEKEFSQKVDFL